MKALRDIVVIKRFGTKEKSSGGIIIAELAREKECEGIVVEVGKDVKDVKVKQHVLFNKYAGTEFSPNGGSKDVYVAMKEEDILLSF